jgi:hypothetical protein
VKLPMNMRGWTFAYWLLWSCFYLTAALTMLHIRAGFVTSYLADLTVPALLYVMSRGLVTGKWRNLLMRWLGRTPERAASFFFLASTATEVSQIYWPRGFFAGRYDPWDIVAYGAGLLVCYGCDKLEQARPPAGGDVQRRPTTACS